MMFNASDFTDFNGNPASPQRASSSKANVSEIMRCLADILSEEALLEGKSAQFSIEFLSYLQKKGQKIAIKNGKTLVDIELNFKVKDLK